MTNDNCEKPRPPGDSRHLPLDDLDDISEAVAHITDDDIEDRLRETLARAGYGCSPNRAKRCVSGHPAAPGDARANANV